MVSSFLNAITEALSAEFGEDYKIWTEDVPQGLDPPCFLITMVTQHREKENRVTYRQSAMFAVQFFPEDEVNYRNETHEVISRLDDCLETIDVDWNGTKRSTHTTATDIAITEGVLSYILRVEDVWFRTDSGDTMDNIESAEIEVSYG